MKRLIIVYNPRSARFLEVQKKIIERSYELRGWMVLKFEVKAGSVEKDGILLEKIIRKGDLVLSAGGDGTATMVMNAIINSGKIATMAVVGFGNFNDFELSLGQVSFEKIVRKFEEGRAEMFYPLDVSVNNRHFRYAGMYCTIGLMAEATSVLEKPKNRKKIKRVKNRMRFSARKLAGWYFLNKRRRDFLPSNLSINGRLTPKYTTDYVAMNGKSLVGLIEAEGWFRRTDVFWSGTMRNRSLMRMFGKFLRAMEGKLPGGETREDRLVFNDATNIWIHTEGEGKKLLNVREVEIKKSKNGLRVIFGD